MSETNILLSNKPTVIGKDIRKWGGDDAFTHLLVIGPTRCGKTSTVLQPMAHEMMKARKRGQKVGFTIIEPKGDLVQDIYDMAVEMGLEDDVIFLDPTNPNSHRLNVMQGQEDAVVEATIAVLKSMFGKQDAFFASVQESSARNVVMMLKRLYKDNLDITTVLENLQDLDVMATSFEAYKKQVSINDDVTKFIGKELLGEGQMAEKYRQLVVGLRVQLSNLISNQNLKRVITGRSDVDILKHLDEGKILLVNTAAGQLGKSGDAFGMYVSMHIQLATFRRGGTEKTRIPHYLIIDEYSQYINPYVARFLSFAASYRVSLIAALQSFSQLEVASGDQDAKTIRNAIVNTARNKIVFGGVEVEDAEFAANMMGLEEIEERQNTFDGGIIPSFIPKSYRTSSKERAKFTPRFFMDGMPRFHCVCKLVEGGIATESFLAKGEWIPQNWRELSKKEDEVLFMSDEERLRLLLENRPPLRNFKERAFFDVEIHKLEKRIAEREENLKKLDSLTLFGNSNENNTEIPNVLEMLSKGKQQKQQQAMTPFVFSTTNVSPSSEEILHIDTQQHEKVTETIQQPVQNSRIREQMEQVQPIYQGETAQSIQSVRTHEQISQARPIQQENTIQSIQQQTNVQVEVPVTTTQNALLNSNQNERLVNNNPKIQDSPANEEDDFFTF